MKFLIEKLHLPLLCLVATLAAVLTACSSSTAPITQTSEAPAPMSTDAVLPPVSPPTAEPVELESEILVAEASSVAAPETGKTSSTASAPASTSSSAPSSASAAPAIFTQRTAIEQGHAVLSGKRSVPCHNAGELLAFYDDYKAGKDASVQLYSFRTQDDNEPLYTLYTLSQTSGVTKMTEDTTHYYDAARYPEQEDAAGVSVLGTFAMTKNKYGFLILDVEGENGLLQYHFQVTGYDELYPSIQKYAEEYERYLAPLAGTGILEFAWTDSTQLLEAGVFPWAFEPIMGVDFAKNRSSYWSEEKKTYCFPQEVVEAVILPLFGFTTDELRGLFTYNAESGSYNYVPQANRGLSDLRILKAAEPEEGSSQYTPGVDESLLELRYEFYSPENGAPEKRGKLTVLLTADDGFRYLGNELFASPVVDEAGSVAE